MRKVRIHAGLRDVLLANCAIFVTDVDYCELSSKSFPASWRNFPHKLIHRLRNNFLNCCFQRSYWNQ